MSEQDETPREANGANDAAESAVAVGAKVDEGAASQNLAYEQARLAYSIIETLLEHTRVTQDLVALLAQVVPEDVQKALTETPHWSAYMDSRRAMERAREEIERFAAEWTRMSAESGDDPTPTP